MHLRAEETFRSRAEHQNLFKKSRTDTGAGKS